MAACALVGCSIGTLETELTVASCSDGEDNDDDGLFDCEDRDCQRLERCRLQAMIAPPTGMLGDPLLPADLGDASDDGPAQDAGAAGDPGLGEPGFPNAVDAGASEVDAAADPMSMSAADAPQCPLLCPTGETCVNGRCVPDPFVIVDLYEITRLEVHVPRSTDYEADTCLDDGCLVPLIAAPFLRCPCLPDPMVVVLVDGEEVGRTTSRSTEFTAWDVSIPLRLLRTSTIRMEVWDEDVESDDSETDALIYACEVDAAPETLATGSIGCTHEFATDAGDLSYSMSATVVPDG